MSRLTASQQTPGGPLGGGRCAGPPRETSQVAFSRSWLVAVGGTLAVVRRHLRQKVIETGVWAVVWHVLLQLSYCSLLGLEPFSYYNWSALPAVATFL